MTDRAGEFSRRVALARGARLAGGVAAGLSLPAVLAACGSGYEKRGPQAEAVLRSSIAVDLASYYAPIEDLRRLTLARGKALGVQVLFSADPAGARAQVDSVTRVLGPKGGFQVIAIAPFDAASVEPLVADAIKRGLQVISFLTPLDPQTSGIVVDQAAAATQLATHAADWLQGHDDPTAEVLLVAPPRSATIPDPFYPYALAGAAALAKAVDATPLRAVATVEALGTADADSLVTQALQARPNIRAILAASDLTALGAATALIRHRAANRTAGYVGALGAPAITSAATLATLEAGGPLRCVVAPRLADLAAALVDVPLGLLRDGKPGVVAVPVQRFTRGARATAAAAADYAPGTTPPGSGP